MKDEEVLELSGWVLECKSPLEISYSEDSWAHRASGLAAQIVIESLRRDLELEVERKAESERINSLFKRLNGS